MKKVRRQRSDMVGTTRALELNEARWQALLDTARDAIISIDQDGCVTLFNRCAEQIFGYAADEVLGRNVSLLMPSPYREEHDRYLRTYDKTGVARAIGRIRDVQGRRKNGEVFPVEISVSETRIDDEVTYLAILRDVTERRSAEEDLRRERDFAERLIETAQVIVLVLDTEGRIVLFNRYMEEITGFPLAEMQGRDWFSSFLPADRRERQRRAFFERLPEVNVQGGVNSILTRNGLLREIEWQVRSLKNPHGEVLGVLAIGQDITDRSRAANRRAAQYAVTRVLAEAASLAEATPQVLQAIGEGAGWDLGELWHVDPEKAVLRIEGVWSAPSLGVSEPDRADRNITFSSGEGLPGRVWASGQAVWVFDVAGDGHILRASAIAKLGLHGAFGFPIRNGSQVTGVMVFFSREARDPDNDLLQMLEALGRQIGDFIERKRSEEGIRYSENRFYAFMNNSPAVAFMKDEEGHFVFVNKTFERLFQTTLEAVRGKSDFDLWPVDVAEELRANDRQVLTTEQSLEVMESVPTPNGSREWLAFKFPITDASGRRFLAGMAIDVTERRRAEEELRRMQMITQERERLADIGAITAKIAHDLGNPLSALSMQAQLILRRARRNESDPLSTVLKPVEQLESEVRRLESLIRELMTFSREQRLDLKVVRPRSFLQRIVDLWQPLAAEGGVTLTLDVRDEVASLRVDEAKLRRVLDNLIKNALEAIDEIPGSVRVLLTAPAPSRVRISVEDSGPGVPKAVQVFRLFETTKANGSGLGLAVAKQIVQAHGGDIFYAAAEPRGTVFHVELPLLGPSS